MSEKECKAIPENDIQNKNIEKIETKDMLLQYMESGIKLESIEGIKIFINSLVDNKLVNFNNLNEIISNLKNNLGLGLQLTPNAALLFKKSIDGFDIIKLSDDNRNTDILIFKINNNGDIIDEKLSNNEVTFDINKIKNVSDFTTLLNNKQLDNIKLISDSKQKLCVLDEEIITQVNNEPKPYVSFMSELKGKAFPFDNQESDIGELITVPYIEQAGVKVESVQQNDIIGNKDSNSGKIIQEQELAVETISYTQYKISKGDNLWKIMRNEYGLSNSTDIANILNVLSKDNNFGITDLNRKLKIGKKLNLPSEIKVKSKSRGDKVMKLKTDS